MFFSRAHRALPRSRRIPAAALSVAMFTTGLVAITLAPAPAQAVRDVQIDWFTSIEAGRVTSCGIRRDGSVRCWGQTPGNGSSDSAAPVTPQGLDSGVTSVSAGYEHACAVKAGVVLCWGKERPGSTR